MGIGLVSLIPVLAAVGWMVSGLGIEGDTGVRTMFFAALVWLAVITWWTLRAPDELSDETRNRYFAPLRHGVYEPDEDAERDVNP